MEFDDKRDSVIGVIDHKRATYGARIKVLAIFNSKHEIKNVNQSLSEYYFPKEGFIFEPNFFRDNPGFAEKDFIRFRVERNLNALGHPDQFKIAEYSKVRSAGVPAIEIKDCLNGLFFDLNQLPQSCSKYKEFYCYDSRNIFGKFRSTSHGIESADKFRLKVWGYNSGSIFQYNGNHFVVDEPTEISFYADCMKNEKLVDWFKKKIHKIDSSYVNFFSENNSQKWQIEIPNFFSEADENSIILDKNRLERLNEIFKSINFSIETINDFIKHSVILKERFVEAVNEHKAEWQKEYQKELDEYKAKVEKQKKQLDEEIRTLEARKEKNKTNLNDLINEIQNSQLEIEQLNQNKERILADFSIIKEVLGNEVKTNSSVKTPELFVIENIEKSENAKLLTTKDDFIIAVQYQLKKLGLFPILAKRIIDVISVFDAILISDIRIGIAMIEATNNATYIIQNVEPDWLHFSNLWENGLGAIWQSSHENPEKLHFLILEDINLSSPECYGRPLFDMILGVRKVIPFGKSPFPKNLRILATVASTENPEIGLPLNKVTFNGWAAIGFKDDIYRKSEDIIEKTNGFVDTSSFLNSIPDEFEANEIKTVVQQEYLNLFDSE